MPNVCRGQLAVKWLSMRGTWKSKPTKEKPKRVRHDEQTVSYGPWTPEEDAKIIARYRTDGPSALAIELGRTYKAVQLRGSRLGQTVPKCLRVA